MSHPLDPLLRPQSIAVLGASERRGSVGYYSVANLRKGGFTGHLYAVNPNRRQVQGLACFPTLDALPETVEHVIFAVADARVESALQDCIAHGARSVTVMSALTEVPAKPVPLSQRVRELVASSGLLMCGPNGMGFYNVRDHVWACGFDSRMHLPPGNVTLISQSGSGMCGIVDCEERLQFNLAVSTGQEFAVRMDEYLDFALDLPETRAVGLFMETVRDPAALAAALGKAAERDIPVIALKVGRSPLAARLALSHSGALAGSDAACSAFFDRHGVQRVGDMDELASALILCAHPQARVAGGLVAVHDSGGERQLLIDVAEEMQVPLTRLAPPAVRALENILDPGLPAINPLDAWSQGGPAAAGIVRESLVIMLRDPGAAIGALVHDRAPGGTLYPEYLEHLRHAQAATGKTVCLVANRQGSGGDPRVAEATRAGLPVLDGLRSFLSGVRCLFGHREFLQRAPQEAPEPDPALVARWRQKLTESQPDEIMAGEMLAEFGLPMNPMLPAEGPVQARAAAERLGYPVVIKTAMPGLAHKSDQGGVHLDLRDDRQLQSACADLETRLGPKLGVARMVSGGVEVLLGSRQDEQFGTLVVMAAGGIHAETLADSVSLLAPFDAATAARRLQALRIWSVLNGPRGAGPEGIAALCEAAANLSAIAHALAGTVAEIDINPVLVRRQDCIAVDALVLTRRQISAAGENP